MTAPRIPRARGYGQWEQAAEAATEIGADEPSPLDDTSMEMLGGLLIAVLAIGGLALLVWAAP